jgi:hypothetical protein
LLKGPCLQIRGSRPCYGKSSLMLLRCLNEPPGWCELANKRKLPSWKSTWRYCNARWSDVKCASTCHCYGDLMNASIELLCSIIWQTGGSEGHRGNKTGTCTTSYIPPVDTQRDHGVHSGCSIQCCSITSSLGRKDIRYRLSNNNFPIRPRRQEPRMGDTCVGNN